MGDLPETIVNSPFTIKADGAKRASSMAIAGASDVGGQVVGAIRDAARVTGTGFEYLLKTAMRESSFNPKAKSSKSSATGLFQFIDQTWLATVKQSGANLGYGKYADAITRTSSGRYVVHNAAMRRAIMNLRYDPKANAVMAGVFTQANAARLSRALGRAPTDGELYIAHVLGQSGAVKLITSAENAPHSSAAQLFPHAARANHSIFFDKQGGARSSADVYRVLVAQHDGTAPPPAAAIAAAPVAPAAPAAPATAALSTVAAPSIVATPPATASPPGPMFGSLFSSERRDGVSPFVRELWGARSAGLVQPDSAPAGLLDRGVTQSASAQPTAAISPAVVTAPDATHRATFQFLRPDVGTNQGSWPI
jgi:transglycosylase-like protein with SLT domain